MDSVLFRDLHAAGVLSTMSATKGFATYGETVPDLELDVPGASAIFARLASEAASSGLLDASLIGS